MILEATQPESLLSNGVVLTTIGTIIIGLFSLTLMLIKYIWKQRKEMILAEVDARVEFNKHITEKIDNTQKMVHEDRVEKEKLNGSINRLNDTVQSVRGFMKTVSNEQKELRSKVEKTQRDVEVIKSKGSQDD